MDSIDESEAAHKQIKTRELNLVHPFPVLDPQIPENEMTNIYLKFIIGKLTSMENQISIVNTKIASFKTRICNQEKTIVAQNVKIMNQEKRITPLKILQRTCTVVPTRIISSSKE
jgi:hypothetical protein